MVKTYSGVQMAALKEASGDIDCKNLGLGPADVAVVLQMALARGRSFTSMMETLGSRSFKRAALSKKNNKPVGLSVLQMSGKVHTL